MSSAALRRVLGRRLQELQSPRFQATVLLFEALSEVAALLLHAPASQLRLAGSLHISQLCVGEQAAELRAEVVVQRQLTAWAAGEQARHQLLHS